MKEGGAYLNNERVTDADAVPGEDAWLAGGWLVLRRGKRAVAGVQRTAPRRLTGRSARCPAGVGACRPRVRRHRPIGLTPPPDARNFLSAPRETPSGAGGTPLRGLTVVRRTTRSRLGRRPEGRSSCASAL